MLDSISIDGCNPKHAGVISCCQSHGYEGLNRVENYFYTLSSNFR